MDGTIDFIVLEHDDVAGCALIAGAVDGVVPAIDGHNTPYIVAMGYDHPTRNWEDCTLFDDIVKAKLAYEGLRGREYPLDVAMRRDDSATLNARALTDAELAIEIEKAGAAMVEHVDAHMAHVHGLGGSEDDSAAYYAARKRHADLRLEKDRRLHASIDLGQREGPRLRQLIARRPRLRRTPLRLYPGTERFGRGAKARHLALPAADRAALPAHLAPDRPARDGIGGGERRIRRRGGPAGTSRV